MKNLNVKNQNGRSMIEMLGVLAIIGVLSVGGIAGYSKAMMKYRINKTIEQITLIAGNVRTFFASQGNYAGLHSENNDGRKIIQKAKLVPDEMWNEDKTALVNAFGDMFSVDATSKSTHDNYGAFDIQLRGIPEEACIELLSHDWQASGMVAIYTDTSSKGEVIAKVPLSVEAATNFCADNSGDDKDTLFMFDIDWNYWSGLGIYIYE